jgi:hypothetical protein
MGSLGRCPRRPQRLVAGTDHFRRAGPDEGDEVGPRWEGSWVTDRGQSLDAIDQPGPGRTNGARASARPTRSELKPMTSQGRSTSTTDYAVVESSY